MSIGMERQLDCSYDQALEKLPAALKAEGFGVLTEIDVSATLKQKIDVTFRRYKILGACNPHYAHQALSHDLNIGVLLPCNLVVYENDQGTATVLSIDPLQTLAAADPALSEIATTVQGKLNTVLQSL
ncbi:MAG: DUF302 domain-containing protein [Deltaproteobacteria bacterium]|nr:DUF302 domain-containing protein [Deltaproteobacteria bacterium]